MVKIAPPHEYQHYAARWTLRRLYVEGELGAALFLDPGLGKTRITLMILEYLFGLGEINRALIIAPLRPVYSVWPAEIRKWGFNLSWSILHDQLPQAMRENKQIELINPAGLPKLYTRSGRKLKRLFPGRWDIIIIDESTAFKTWGRLRSKLARGLVHGVPKRIILTGTPAAQSLADLHGQMFIVDDGEALGKTVTYFRAQYMQKAGWKGKQWLLLPDQDDKILNAIADRTLRMDAESFLDMPDLVYNDMEVAMPDSAAPEYRRLKRDLLAKLESGEVWAKTAAAAYGKCKQFAGGAVYDNDEAEKGKQRPYHVAHDRKIEALADLLDELNGKSLLVAFNYGHELKRLKAHPYFKKALVIAGKDETGKAMSAKEVDKTVDAWNARKARVLLAQPQSMAHGLNLQAGGNDVAWFGLPDSQEVYAQFNRRIYRQGVKGQVRIHHILTRDTVDSIILDRLKQRGDNQAAFLAALKAHAKS